MKYLNYTNNINTLVGKVLNGTNVILSNRKLIYINTNGEFIINDSYEYTSVSNIELEDSYILYYETTNNEIIDTWSSFNKNTSSILPMIAPYNADHIGIYSNNEKIGILNLDSQYFMLKHEYGDRLYRVGLISDVHYDDTCAADENEHSSTDSGNTYNPYEDLENVLKFYQEKEDIDFICCAGDVSTNYINHVKSFYNRVQILAPTTPIYSCKGNHDNAASYNQNDLWLQYTIPTNGKYTINYFTSGDKTSFYYETENNDVYIFFNLDYNNSSATATITDSEGNYTYYNEDTIKELQSILDTNRNKRCFVFTHQYFSQKTGNPKWDYSIMHTHDYFLSGKQFKILNSINNYYRNSVWFSGHTHYKWDWQSICDRANVCNFDILNDNYDYTDYKDYTRNSNNKYDENWHVNDVLLSAWNVHLPSTCRPLNPQNYLKISNYSDAIEDPGSEGGIMDVYEDGINIRGIVFCDKNSTSSTSESIDYDSVLNFASNQFIIDTTKSGYSSEQSISQDGDYVVITFTAQSQRIIQTTFGGQYVFMQDLQIINGNGDDITVDKLTQSNPKVGYYTTSGSYSVGNCTANKATVKIGIISVTGLEFPCSSSNTDVFPLTIKIKGYTCDKNVLKTINYENKYNPLANYWLPVGGKNTIELDSKDYSYFE